MRYDKLHETRIVVGEQFVLEAFGLEFDIAMRDSKSIAQIGIDLGCLSRASFKPPNKIIINGRLGMTYSPYLPVVSIRRCSAVVSLGDTA